MALVSLGARMEQLSGGGEGRMCGLYDMYFDGHVFGMTV